MSAGKVLALIVVVVGFAIVAVAVSWCCWCIRNRYGDKNVQAVKSAATVADTMGSMRTKSSVSAVPPVGATAAPAVADPAAARPRRLLHVQANCGGPVTVLPDHDESALLLYPKTVAEELQHACCPGPSSDNLPPVLDFDGDQTSLMASYMRQTAEEPLIAGDLYKRTGSKLDIFSRAHSPPTPCPDTPTKHGYRTIDNELERIGMRCLSEHKQSKFDLFSRENTLMNMESSASKKSTPASPGGLQDFQIGFLEDFERDRLGSSLDGATSPDQNSGAVKASWKTPRSLGIVSSHVASSIGQETPTSPPKVDASMIPASLEDGRDGKKSAIPADVPHVEAISSKIISDESVSPSAAWLQSSSKDRQGGSATAEAFGSLEEAYISPPETNESSPFVSALSSLLKGQGAPPVGINVETKPHRELSENIRRLISLAKSKKYLAASPDAATQTICDSPKSGVPEFVSPPRQRSSSATDLRESHQTTTRKKSA